MNFEYNSDQIIPLSSMFTVPYLQLGVRDWDNKKKKLLELMSKCNFTNSNSILESSFYDESSKNHNDLVESIFEDELGLAKKSFGFNHYSIKYSWFQEQTKNMFHPIHDHGENNIMMSSICYIEYDSLDHSPTQFISPFVDSFTFSHSYFMPRVNEGTIIFFPSNVLHQTLPSPSDKPRKIISFNMELG